MTETQGPASFRLAYVPGVTPAKWVRVWKERLPDVPLALIGVAAADGGQLLLDGGADAGLVRLPVDRTRLSAIPLYTETTVVVIPTDHPATAATEVAAAELSDLIVLHPLDDTLAWETRPGLPAIERPATTADAIELVAAGVGVLVVPQSLARLHHRKDLTYRPVPDAPQSQVALSWPEDRTTDLVEEFIGIVRGRTANSTRGRTPAATQPKQEQKQRKKQPKPQQKQGATTGKPRQGAAGKQAGGRKRSGSGTPATGRRGKPGRRS
ncbi:LysR substrate-binding domain-containing protein [Streptacidiphilus sp. EB129]|uniref:LysR substrate-binding domain-containing protein n=1 Tax=Streptacidiphilus sp. EB129 TaxID=3156262 RepID=UPI0035188DBA